MVADLYGNDTLDLVASDRAGYLFAWKLGPGSMDKQPWPTTFGNNWNTCYTGYKAQASVSGYLNEDWKTDKIYHGSPTASHPFSWVESGAGNGCDTVTSSNQFGIVDDTMRFSGSAQDQNLTYVGPGTENWKNYIVKAKVKFSGMTAAFGINVYSRIFEERGTYVNQKYSILRLPGGKLAAVAYSGFGDSTILQITGDGKAPLPGTWYNLKIYVYNGNGHNSIKAECWPADSADPTLDPNHPWSIETGDNVWNTQITGGSVGLAACSGSGNLLWSPISAVANDDTSGANIAKEDFRTDTSVVDIAPYTPANWHPDYGNVRFDAEIGDSTGFTLDKANGALAYRPKPGVEYPVTCRLIPYTNLPWRDYEFSGKIVKPVGAVYDSIWVGVDMYSGEGGRYRFAFKDNTLRLSGGRFNDSNITLTQHFRNGDTLLFEIRMLNTNRIIDTTNLQDGWIKINVSSCIDSIGQHNSLVALPTISDSSSTRIINGTASVFIDLNGKENHANDPVRIQDAILRKIDQ